MRDVQRGRELVRALTRAEVLSSGCVGWVLALGCLSCERRLGDVLLMCRASAVYVTCCAECGCVLCVVALLLLLLLLLLVSWAVGCVSLSRFSPFAAIGVPLRVGSFAC